jgi:hypothetical protein
VDARSWSNAGCTAGFVPTVWRTGGTTPPGWKIGGLDVNQKWVKLIRIG